MARQGQGRVREPGYAEHGADCGADEGVGAWAGQQGGAEAVSEGGVVETDIVTG
jgi:hypothetical protein